MKILLTIFVLINLQVFFKLSSTIGSANDAPCVPGEAGNYKRVCYFENWAWYRPGEGKMFPKDIDPSLCTHLMYSFATLDANSLLMKSYDTWADINNKFYEKITSFKTSGVKVMIAIGGWNDSADKKYSRLVNDAAARQRFINGALAFIEEHNFDGLDLDWEYPRCWQGNCNAGPVSDKQNFGVFVKELSEAFKPKGLLLSAAVSAGKTTIDDAYDVPTLGKYLDFINVMTYDFKGSWDSKTGHHSQLYKHSQDSKDYTNTDYSIAYWMKKGAPKEKLVMGMPLYGQSFTLSSAASNGLNAPSSGPGQAGAFTGQGGLLAYYEICHSIKSEGWKVVRQTKEMGPFAYKDKQWVSYDDQATIRTKCEYIKSHGLGGGMVWAIGMDDFKNRCGDGPYPLLNVIKDVLTSGNDCIPATTPKTPPTSVAPQEPTTANPSPLPQTTVQPNPPTNPPKSTPKPNPQTTPDNSGPSNCRPTDIYASQPGMAAWCDQMCNAAVPYCPASHCICGAPEPPPQTTAQPQGCRPTDLYASQPGMADWCIANCKLGYCPASHCIC